MFWKLWRVVHTYTFTASWWWWWWLTPTESETPLPLSSRSLKKSLWPLTEKELARGNWLIEQWNNCHCKSVDVQNHNIVCVQIAFSLNILERDWRRNNERGCSIARIGSAGAWARRIASGSSQKIGEALRWWWESTLILFCASCSPWKRNFEVMLLA